MKVNYSKLRGKIREVYGTQEKFAIQLGIGQVSLSKRLTGELDFKQSEIERACKLLKIQPSEITLYFFN